MDYEKLRRAVYKILESSDEIWLRIEAKWQARDKRMAEKQRSQKPTVEEMTKPMDF